MPEQTINKIINGKLPLDFNWNSQFYKRVSIPSVIPASPTFDQIKKIQIVSEDLRDGLHGISTYPTLDTMIKYIKLMIKLGITNMTIGIYPGEKNIVNDTIKALLKYTYKYFPQITPNVLSIVSKESLQWTAECKKLNPKLNALIFMGSAPSRLLVEEWDKDYILKQLAWAIRTATKEYKIDVIGSTEHTTQTPPDFLRDIIKVQVENGAKYFCVADTIGIARPVGTARIINFVKNTLKDLNAKHVLVDWHGHDDLGNGVSNAMTAIAAGADRIHTVARGIGERAGNTRMESILLNCAEIAYEFGKKSPWNLKMLNKVISFYDELTENLPPTHGPLGNRAFSTSLGIHTSAMLKAELLTRKAQKLKYYDLAAKLKHMSRTIYSAIDASDVGRIREIRVGPWSGQTTVRLASINLGISYTQLSEEIIQQVLSTAKKFGRELTTEELVKLLGNHNPH